MPFRSRQQAKWMFANKPEMAKEWASKTPSIKALPRKVKKHKKITMSKSEAVKEHRHLVKVLKSGKGLKAEAKKQNSELKEYMKAKGFKMKKRWK